MLAEVTVSSAAKRFFDGLAYGELASLYDLPVGLLLLKQPPLGTDGCSGIIFAILAYDSKADQAGDNYCYIGDAGELLEHHQDAC
jgi:hypothetical protein